MALEDQIETAAGKAKKVTVDGQTIERPTLPELIEADKHLQQNTAARQKNFGIRLGQLRNQGTT